VGPALPAMNWFFWRPHGHADSSLWRAVTPTDKGLEETLKIRRVFALQGTAAEVSVGGMQNVLICAPMLSHQQRTSRRAERRLGWVDWLSFLHGE
jgi:hypothetical protein